MVSMALTLVDPTTAVQQARGYMDVVRTLRSDLLRSGVDYGVIPGTAKIKVKDPVTGKEVERDREVLLKPGAERLCSAFGFAPVFELVNKVELWDADKPLFHYQYCCKLIHIDSGKLVATGIGSCNSMEDKYRWRKSERVCPACGKENIRKSKEGGWYCWTKTGGCGGQFKADDPRIADQQVGRVLNEDIFSLVNTIDKMAQKRALVAATLIGCNASEFFTQDVDDMPNFGTVRGEVIDAEVVDEPPAKPNLKVADKPKPEPEQSSVFWYDDDTKRKKFFDVLAEKLHITNPEAVKLVGKPLHEFKTGKEAYDAIEAALNASLSPAQPKNGKPHWSEDTAQMGQLTDHLKAGFDLTADEALKRLGKASWKAYINLDAAKADIIETATTQNWDMVATHAHYYEYGSSEPKQRIIRFCTPRLVVWYKGRKELIKTLEGSATTLWFEVKGWEPQKGDLTKIPGLALPEAVKITARQDKDALVVDKIVALATQAVGVPF